MSPRCVYQVASADAYRLDADGFERPVSVTLCEWPDQHPERLVDAPRWMLKLIGAGLAIQPERDCSGCPALRPPESADQQGREPT